MSASVEPEASLSVLPAELEARIARSRAVQIGAVRGRAVVGSAISRAITVSIGRGRIHPVIVDIVTRAVIRIRCRRGRRRRLGLHGRRSGSLILGDINQAVLQLILYNDSSSPS